MIQDYLRPNSIREKDNFSRFQQAEDFLKNMHFKQSDSFTTKSIHFNQPPEEVHGSVNIPVHITSTYAQARPGQIWSRFDYTRCGNPTREVLEKVLAHLEHGQHNQTFNHYRATVAVILLSLVQGDEVLVTQDIDHDTSDVMHEMSIKFNYRFHKTPTWDVQTVQQMLQKNKKVKMLWVMTPSYSENRLSDIQKLSEICKESGVVLVVDNTLSSPLLCTPLDLGADIVVNKVDYLISGHDDLAMGSLTVNQQSLHDRLFLISKSYGGVSTPLNSYLCLRELKTMQLRVEEMCRNAYVLASLVQQQPEVEKVYFHGLQGDSQRPLLHSQMTASAVRFSFSLKSGKQNLDHFVNKLDLFHYGDGAGSKSQVFIANNLIVVSAGTEDVHDLMLNFEEAFQYLNSIQEKQELANKMKVKKQIKKVKKNETTDSKKTGQDSSSNKDQE